ncbi:MAG: hydrogenase maturation protease [Epsilonproteobacteria bacterium]|nr:hydrogenase maturation protease [Campylobacterota bacterium]
MIILGIGNILQKDDGIGVYASTYLKENYNFSPDIDIINGGVEGINLYSIFEENQEVLIVDSIEIDDTPSSIYLIPADKLRGYGLNSGGAHEMGVLQCLDMLELQGKDTPTVNVLGIVPAHITFEIDLSSELKEAFNGYIKVVLNFLNKKGVEVIKKDELVSLEEIIKRVRRV